MSDTIIDDYWTRTEEIGRLPLPPRDDEWDVWFIWHQSVEQYRHGHTEIGLRLTRAGERDYVHAKAVFHSPRIILTFAVTPPVPSDLGEEVGQVEDVRQEGQIRHEVASCQAWYYRNERTLMLWEVDMRMDYREEDPSQDFLFSTIWQAFERRLLTEFPDCERILTPGWEPSYEGKQFRAFLASQGFTPHEDNTFIKTISMEV
jgi:hypothetical protein